jgi:hypothetical protein
MKLDRGRTVEETAYPLFQLEADAIRRWGSEFLVFDRMEIA